jgi:hypothetical protein
MLDYKVYRQEFYDRESLVVDELSEIKFNIINNKLKMKITTY